VYNRDFIGGKFSPAQPDGSSLRSFPTSAARILVVDDDEGVRDIFGEVLRANGYDVHSAGDGEAGWAALSDGSTDLLITDHEMPGLTGGDLLLRARAAHFILPVILVSGKLVWPDSDLLRVLQPGVALGKPFSWADLLANARRLISASPADLRNTRAVCS
jgi:DNA-binding response OmpR family regulator